MGRMAEESLSSLVLTPREQVWGRSTRERKEQVKDKHAGIG